MLARLLSGRRTLLPLLVGAIALPLAAQEAGIQWFGTWEQGKAEAERTGRPILFTSAAPQCRGISGLW